MSAFLAAALDEVPRLLGCLDRSPSSPHFGSFDRQRWHYRASLVPCARLQEGMLTLALLLLEPFEGNRWHADPDVAAWLDGAVDRACDLQHGDGSFDEWYPREGSFVATSFVTNAMAETLLLCRRRGHRPGAEARALAAVAAGARWLVAARERTVANQSAGAVAALSAAAEVLGDATFARAAAVHAAELVARQSPEGWWAEYGGPDTGYLSLHVDYLSRYFARTRDAAVGAALARALRFLAHLLHPDGSAGGVHMARNTEYLIPSGFARLEALGMEEARLPAAAAHRGVRMRRGVVPRVLDDRYICYTLYNWIEAGLLRPAADETAAAPLATRVMDAWFPQAGIRVRCDADHYLALNLRKGGAFRLLAGGRWAVDGGLELVRERAVAGALGSASDVTSSPAACETRFRFTPVRAPVLTPLRGGAFYAAQTVLGRFPPLRRALKAALRRAAIQYAGGGLAGTRRFEFGARVVRVVDTVEAPVDPRDVRVGAAGAYILVPSSRYCPVEDRFSVEPVVRREAGRTVFERVFAW